MRIWIVLAGLVVALVGCSGPKTVTQMPPESVEAAPEYRIGVGDVLSVQVWKSPELSVARLPVRPDGKISVPLIGDVVAVGQTSDGLGSELTAGFLEYVRNPQVTVSVVEAISAEYLRRVRVTGAVSEPLSVPFQKGMTVMDLILQAGGLTEFARPNKTKLYRRVGDKVEAFPVYLDDILNKGRVSTNYTLQPSDTVTVPERVF